MLPPQYVIAQPGFCVPLPDDVTFEEGCALFVNPLTVEAFIQLAKSAGVSTVVHTAGGSALGKMLIRAGKRLGVGVIPVIRSAANAAELRALGAVDVIVNGGDAAAGWKDRLRKACADSGARIAFDAVGGALTGDILACLPRGVRA